MVPAQRADILRGQLSQPPKEYGTALSKPAAAIVGNVLTNVIARPQFIAYKIGPKPLSVRLCEAMGAVRAGWTSPAPGRTSATTTSSSSSTTVPARGSARTSERRASLHTVKNSQQPSRQMPARLLAVDCCAARPRRMQTRTLKWKREHKRGGRKHHSHKTMLTEHILTVVSVFVKRFLKNSGFFLTQCRRAGSAQARPRHAGRISAARRTP